ncbi:MAG: 30S ribosomal protein S8 [Patescibacteria group bacterium]
MDPISDMLTRIRNALAVKKPEVIIPFSKIKFAIAKILEKEKFIEKVEKIPPKKKKSFYEIKITLKYKNGEPAIRELKRISKPGCRVYLKANKIKPVKGGLGILIISTSRGIMTGQEARKRKLGGEVLAEIW